MIDSGQAAQIWAGNLELVRQEQTVVVVPFFTTVASMTISGVPDAAIVTLASKLRPPFSGAETFLDWSVLQASTGGGGLFTTTAVRWQYLLQIWNEWQLLPGRFGQVGLPLP
jgi:hypothetical protein